MVIIPISKTDKLCPKEVRQFPHVPIGSKRQIQKANPRSLALESMHLTISFTPNELFQP